MIPIPTQYLKEIVFASIQIISNVNRPLAASTVYITLTLNNQLAETNRICDFAGQPVVVTCKPAVTW